MDEHKEEMIPYLVLKRYREMIFHAAHHNLLAGHLRQDKTLNPSILLIAWHSIHSIVYRHCDRLWCFIYIQGFYTSVCVYHLQTNRISKLKLNSSLMFIFSFTMICRTGISCWNPCHLQYPLLPTPLSRL